jgi:hypothetical protein
VPPDNPTQTYLCVSIYDLLPVAIWVWLDEHQRVNVLGENVPMRITVEQVLPITVNPLTARGRVAIIDGAVEFRSADETIATIVQTGPTTAYVKPTGTPGLVQIHAKFDADITEQFRTVETSATVEIVAAEATTGEIVFGEPTAEPEPAPEEPEPEPPTPSEPTSPTEPPPPVEPEPTPPQPPVEEDMDAVVQLVRVPAGTVIPQRKYGPTIVNVRNFGAVGDGVTNDTAAFKAAITALPADGGTVRIPKGDYLLTPGLTSWLRSNLRLYADQDAYLHTAPNDDPKAYLLYAQDMHDIVFQNIRLRGDRMKHIYVKFPPRTVTNADGTTSTVPNALDTHEWGHGVAIRGASAAISFINCDFQFCTGDGASVAGNDIFIYGLRSQYNRRQGLTVGGATNVKVYNCDLLDTGDFETNLGTNPKGGIDIEPDSPRDARNIHVYGCRILRNRVGIEIYANTVKVGTDGVEITEILIEENELAYNSLGSANTRVNGLIYRRNNIHDNRAHGIKTISASNNVVLDDNRYHNNYTQVGEQKPRSFRLAGVDSRTTRDLNIDSEATNVQFPTESLFD